MQLSRPAMPAAHRDGSGSVLTVADYTGEVHPEAVYQALLDHDIFAVHECTQCGRAHYSPRVLCPYCGSVELTWRQSAGLGTVYSASTISPRDAEPYAVVLVDLDEGPRLMSNVVGIPAAAVRIGMRVRARIVHREGGAVAMFSEDTA
jgi:uncharacterized OB-fold protein